MIFVFIKDFAKEFSKKILLLFQDVQIKRDNYDLIKSFLSSVTAIEFYTPRLEYYKTTKLSANIIEKAQKSCTETKHWLDILGGFGYISTIERILLTNDCDRLHRRYQKIINLFYKHQKTDL